MLERLIIHIRFIILFMYLTDIYNLLICCDWVSGRSNIIEREVNKQVGDLFQDKKGLKVWLYINYIEVPVLHSIDLYKVIAINILFNYFNNLEN